MIYLRRFASANSIAELHITERQQERTLSRPRQRSRPGTEPAYDERSCDEHDASSEFVDHIHAEKELISKSSVVISTQVPRVIKAEFGSKHNRVANVFGDIQRIFRIF